MKKRRKYTSEGTKEPASKELYLDENSYESLLKHNKEECPICYRVFRNRYKCIVHTMTHITIPLIKNSLEQCSQCKLHFPSQEDLDQHVSKKHVKVENDCRKNRIEMSLELPTVNECESKTFELETVSKKHVKVESNCRKNRKEMSLEMPIVNECESKTFKLETVSKKLDSIRRENGTEVSPLMPENECVKSKIINLGTVKHRSKKHVKIDSNCHKNKEKMSPELPPVNECVKLENVKGEPVLCEISNNETKALKDISHDSGNEDENNVENTKIDIKNRIFFEDDEILMSLDKSYQEDRNQGEVTRSVHYDELKESGRFPCKYCKKMFYDRYNLIVHQGAHIYIKPPSKIYFCPVCDRFTTKTKTRHIFEVHRELFTMNYLKKELKYCKKYNLPFDEPQATSRVRPERPQRNIGVFKLCELCYVLSRCKVSVVKNISELNKQCCFKCREVFFEGKLVRGFTGKAQMVRKYEKIPLKQHSNETRLKNIQHRWKVMKKIK